MPQVTVVCPTCATRLDLDAEHLGTDVQCGSCHEVFTAKKEAKKSSRKDDDDNRPRRTSRRDDDDDDDDRPRRRRRRSESGGGEPPVMAIFGLIFGLSSLVGACCCFPLGVGGGALGLLLSLLGRKQSPGLGIAGAVMSGLGIVLSVGLLAVGMAANMGQFGGPNNFNNWNAPQPQPVNNNMFPQPRRNNFR